MFKFRKSTFFLFFCKGKINNCIKNTSNNFLGDHFRFHITILRIVFILPSIRWLFDFKQLIWCLLYEVSKFEIFIIAVKTGWRVFLKVLQDEFYQLLLLPMPYFS